MDKKTRTIMKEKVKFQIGSKAFFGVYEDFSSKDNDTLYIMEGWGAKSNILNFRKSGRDCFFIKEMSKEELIVDTLKSGISLRAGKFLVKEFAEYIGMTIEDLKLLEPLFDGMDDKHSYEKVIYDAYIKNNAFKLLKRQRDKAYKVYKASRAEK